MEKRRTIGSLVVALLVLISPLPAMCSQCRFTAVGQNCSATHRQAATIQQAAAMTIPGVHCQHVANSQSKSRSHFASRALCQDTPCQQSMDSATKLNRLDSARLVVSFRSVTLTEVSDDGDLVGEALLHSYIEKRLLNSSAYQPLSVTLRI